MRDHFSSSPSVVVGIDGSRSALDAALWAVDEAVSRDIPLRLVYAIEPPSTDGADPRDAARQLATAEIAVRQAFMAVESTDKPVKIEVEILQDRPTRALLDASRWAALLCVGSIGLKHSTQGRIGSTAAALAASAHCPVAVVRGHDPRQSKQKWVVAEVDESAASDGVLRLALEEAQLRGAPLHVLTTWQSRFSDVHDGHAVADGNRLAKAQLDRRLAQWTKRYPELDVGRGRSRQHPELPRKECELNSTVRGGPRARPRDHGAGRAARQRGAARHRLFGLDLRTSERIVSSTSAVTATSTEGLGVVKVFLVDDHEVVRRGLIDLLSADAELDVVGEAGSVAQALARIPALQPDVAVLDVRLPDGNGIELCRDLLSRLPNLRCLMLTSFTSDEAMLDAILAGASGYVVKDIKGMELAQAIKDVGAGRSLLDNRAAAALMAKLRGAAEHSDPLSGLSDQERVLLDLLGEGLTNKQIAARMFLAEKTVKNYVSRLLAKLGMERRTQAAVFISKLDQSHRHPEE